jgi:hypothetical protein
VTTPAENCARHYHADVVTATPLFMTTRPLGVALEKIAGTPMPVMPLTLALEYARAHGDALARTFDGVEMFRAWMAEIDAAFRELTPRRGAGVIEV